MASIRFPSAPTLNQNFTASGRTWKWAGSKWLTVPASVQYATSTKVDTLESTLAADLAAKASAADLATKASTADLAAKAPLVSPTFSGTVASQDLTVTGVTKVKPIIETAGIVISGFAGYTFDVKTGAVKYLVLPSTGNGVLNIRGDSSTTLASMLAIGESISIALMITNNTAYGVTGITIDGAAPNSTRWLGGTFPTKSSGAVDVYSFTVVRTGTSNFDLFASMSKFA